jgi:hypothetical protein
LSSNIDKNIDFKTGENTLDHYTKSLNATAKGFQSKG